MFTAISRKVVGKNVHATIPKGNMGYDQYTVPDDCSCRTYFCCFPLALEKTFSWPFVPILSNFFEEQRTQNHPQCLSQLSRALFPTTFLETAVFKKKDWPVSRDPVISGPASFSYRYNDYFKRTQGISRATPVKWDSPANRAIFAHSDNLTLWYWLP